MKRWIAVFLTLVLLVPLCLQAFAASDAEQNTADALHALNLFMGYGDDADGNPVYGLDDDLNRAQGLVLLIRMLGKEAEAKACTDSHPFTDVDAGYKCYVAYAYKTGLTKGVSATKFGSNDLMNSTMFTTFCLRALGYTDSGANADFAYNDAAAFAEQKGITAAEQGENGGITRGGAVLEFWDTLCSPVKGKDTLLADRLISAGLFTSLEFAAAVELQGSGESYVSASASDLRVQASPAL